MVTMKDGWYGEGSYLWTVFCKLPTDKRGEYAEEIDVRTKWRSRADVKRVAEAVIKQDYDDTLRVSRIVSRIPGTFF